MTAELLLVTISVTAVSVTMVGTDHKTVKMAVTIDAVKRCKIKSSQNVFMMREMMTNTKATVVLAIALTQKRSANTGSLALQRKHRNVLCRAIA